jgi:hypothetical protein
MSPGDENSPSGGYTDTGQTRTRLPEGDPYGGARRGGRSSSRSLVTVVGVVVLLIAAIAFANRGGSGGDNSAAAGSAGGPAASATAATGTNPVRAKTSGIPSGFSHDQQGAQSAAANYAVALWSDGMVNQANRQKIVETVADPRVLNQLLSDFDANYSADFLKNIGLDGEGKPPSGDTFVSRTLPAGTKVTSYSTTAATVEVWCNGLFGLAGEGSTNPVTSGWFTVTFKLDWNGNDWKVLTASQRTGPTPIAGDSPVSGAGEIGKAVKEFGGFTYAR